MTATSAMALLIDRSMRRSSETAIRAGSVERVHHSYELDDPDCVMSLPAEVEKSPRLTSSGNVAALKAAAGGSVFVP